jgi:glycosyltransferase involved in cell wall biosynthesis
MNVAVFLNSLGLGGTEKAACRWAWGLRERGHQVTVLTLRDGPRRAELEQHGVRVRIVDGTARAVADSLREVSPDAIHVHAPGHPHDGDVLGAGLALLQKKIPVVQTNIFGHLRNPKEDAWTDFRLFISWTSCVQAARRVFVPLDELFFRRASVAVYPVDPVEAPAATEITAFRSRFGVTGSEVLFGRLSRPDPAKWTNLVTDAFVCALRSNHTMKLLLREPPPHVAEQLHASPTARHFIILPATADPDELRLTMASLDVVLHTSSIGESFGYGIAEPMNLGKPVITHSVPWQDQAQLELVRHGECGFVASTPAAMAEALARLTMDAPLREQMGLRARQHIRALADPGTSIGRIEQVLRVAVEGGDNPFVAEDLRCAKAAAAYLDTHQFGHGLRERIVLCPFYWRVRLHEWRQAVRLRKAREQMRAG